MHPTDFPGFPPQTMGFLRELALNNNRDWFQENKSRYESDVLGPALDFVASMQAPLSGLSENFHALPKRVGGSLMRIYRDTRFSKNKLPYKTNIGIQFRHTRGKDVHAPGFYVHIDPDRVFIGAGLWRPERESLTAIRERIAENPSAWRRAVGAAQFKRLLALSGESLTRAPRGFDAGHPLIDDIRRKDFIAVRNLDHVVIHGPEFQEEVMCGFRAARPLMRFLCDAVGVPF